LFSQDLRSWDQYAVLRESGVSFIAIEDTGKVLPLRDLKIGTCICSADLYEDCARLHNDLLLNVSPFILKLNTEVLRLVGEHGIDRLLATVETNRKIVRDSLRGSSGIDVL
jgi:hypothetical protein